MNACTVDLGAPFSVSMLQRVRVTTFVKPGLVLDVRCSAAGPSSGLSFLGGMGVAVQQLAARGLDLHLGVQRIFRRGVGYAIGATLSYTRVP
jgi:hypothetical protein